MRVLRNTATGVALALTSAAALFAATPAAAQVPNAPGATPPFTYTTLYFTAPCADCTDALGILTLANYVTGALMGPSHFVDFKYTSSVLNFEITPGDLKFFRGLFTDVPGEDFVQIEQFNPPVDPGAIYPSPPFRLFETTPSYTDPNPNLSHGSSWQEIITSAGGSQLPAGTGSDVAPDDYGTHFTWSTVDPRGDAAPAPEPAGWALMIAGFGLTGAALRAARRSTAAAAASI